MTSSPLQRTIWKRPQKSFDVDQFGTDQIAGISFRRENPSKTFSTHLTSTLVSMLVIGFVQTKCGLSSRVLGRCSRGKHLQASNSLMLSEVHEVQERALSGVWQYGVTL